MGFYHLPLHFLHIFCLFSCFSRNIIITEKIDLKRIKEHLRYIPSKLFFFLSTITFFVSTDLFYFFSRRCNRGKSSVRFKIKNAFQSHYQRKHRTQLLKHCIPYIRCVKSSNSKTGYTQKSEYHNQINALKTSISKGKIVKIN